MTLDTWASIATIIGGAAILIAGGAWIGRKLVRPILRFLDDWNGEPARPGFLGRPSFPERMAGVEAEVNHNHGSSMKDAVARVERTLADHCADAKDQRKAYESDRERLWAAVMELARK